jgi:hypothetical protein
MTDFQEHGKPFNRPAAILSPPERGEGGGEERFILDKGKTKCPITL